MAGSWEKFWRGIDANNLSSKHRDMLMNDVYGGYKTRTVSVRGRRGKYGYGPSSTKQVVNYDYYNDGGWEAVKGAVGIKNVNSTDEIRRLYDYVSGYRPPAPKAKAAPAPVQATPAPSTPTNQYQSQVAALTASIQRQQQENARAQAAAQAAAERREAAARQAAQKDYQSQLSAMQNLYASNLQSTKDQFGLQISGLQKSMTDQAADFKTQQQTMATNQERARLAGATPELKLQQSADQKIGGTTTFKKRVGTQFNAPTYGSLATIKSGTLNI